LPKYGFKPELVGGIYYLQGRLAQPLPQSRDRFVLAQLLFVGIAWIVGPLVARGTGHDRELDSRAAVHAGRDWWFCADDVISGAGHNGLHRIAIDSMIHLVFGVRRAQRDGRKGWERLGGRTQGTMAWHRLFRRNLAAGFAIFRIV